MKYHILFLWLTVWCFIASPMGALAQKASKELEKKRNEKLATIRANNKMLKEISQKKINKVGKLHVVREQIHVQKKFITALKDEIADIEEDIQKKQQAIVDFQADLEALKKEYATMVYALAKAQSAYRKMLFLFSADSFNQLYKRILYLNQYQDTRKKQFEEIKSISVDLQREKNTLELSRKEKQNLLNEKLGINNSLKNLENDNVTLLKQLSKEELKLKADIEEDKKSILALENAISQMVRREMNKENTPTTTPDQAPLTKKKVAFSKGKLLFPVKKGFIAGYFGKHEHPVLQGVTIENNGVEIQTEPNEAIYAVAEGKVTAIAKIPSMAGQVVMIQHGEFFSVYAKVTAIRVKVGQIIKGGQHIAQVLTDAEKGENRFELQLWHRDQKLNPSIWLSGR